MGDELMKREDFNLPYATSPLEKTANEVSCMNAAAFITEQRTIRVLHVRGEVSSLPFPPDTLPDLRELEASPGLPR